MYFTRDPVIETVITAREGYKLSIRNSKHVSQDPFVVEAVEVVSVGKMGFFRNCDRTKPFLVPVSDYEVMEIRDARINLKAVGLEKGVKIAGGREALLKLSRPVPKTVVESEDSQDQISSEESVDNLVADVNAVKKSKKEFSSKSDKWKEKKRQGKRKSSKDVAEVADSSKEVLETVVEEVLEEQAAEESVVSGKKKFSLLPPPSKLISEVFSKGESSTSVGSESSVVGVDVDLNLQDSLDVLASEGNSGVASILEKGESVNEMFALEPEGLEHQEDSFS
ncbi:hypothetical protein [Chlamydiifrater volucris]|uniref:hypothetical protein n=1 Tax=Chlamydiifrater volucris TaxID=2681470 RepID=UPI001BCEA3C6|nr:hypothetical protein [Chlamydiifrater volucris]